MQKSYDIGCGLHQPIWLKADIPLFDVKGVKLDAYLPLLTP